MERLQTIQQRAQQLFEQETDWATFFRDILGVNGLVHQLYPDAAERTQIEKSDQFMELRQMLAALRDRNGQTANPEETTRVITVRLPKCLHESLRAEAHLYKTSMNQLCITKLLQSCEEELVEVEAQASQ